MPELEDRVTSVATLITLGAERLRAAGLSDARREALHLWADLRGMSTATVLLRQEAPVAEAASREFLARIERRAAGEPRAYIGGVAGFRRLTLACDRRALIPRPETEGLIDALLERVQTGVVADIGTGTGCLALSLATEGRFRAVLAVDRSADALALTAENVTAIGAEVRRNGTPVAVVHLLRGDLSTALGADTVDALVSNPPYLSAAEYTSIDPSVGEWEPALALVSGHDGLAATTRLLDDGRRVVRPGGWLALEVDCTRAVACARRATDFGWRDVAIYNDLFGRERYLLARRSNLS